jgi:hypothetical protein
MPIPEIMLCAAHGELVAPRTASIAVITAAKPAAASFATIGVRVWQVISPAAFTRPAATFVPPTSTPMRCPVRETSVMRFAPGPDYT